MTDISPRRRTHRLLAGLGAAASTLALTATLAPAPALAGPPSSPPGASRAAEPARSVDVMTRNLYLGADLLPVVGALLNPSTDGDPLGNVKAAATLTWNNVQATRPEERMSAIADEIADERPAVVGLQEVTEWTTYDVTATGVKPTVRYDFLDLLLDALAERGVTYHEVEGATATNFASAPIPLAPGSESVAVSMQDRDVILVRDGVETTNPRNGNFTNKIETPLEVDRGWGSVDVTAGKASFRFVNSHLEAFAFTSSGTTAEELRVLQVQELLEAQAAITEEHGDLPMVYVGDYNSDAPVGPAYEDLVAGVGEDAWTRTNRNAPGNTCCFDDLVTDPAAELDSRIDLVVVDDAVEATHAEVLGEETTDLTASGLWPSDHAGVVARLVVTPERGR